MPAQPVVNSATGGSFVSVWSVPGSSTTVNRTDRVTAALVVAVRPATAPSGMPPSESPRMPLTLPVPVDSPWVRVSEPLGSVQVTGVEDFSLQ